MPLIVTFIGLLASACSSLVGRVLLALGMGYVTYSGFDLSVQWLLAQVKLNFSGMPTEVVSFLGWLWVDRAIGMVFAAYTAALVVRLSSSGTLTRLVTK